MAWRQAPVADLTVRQVVPLSVGGDQVRVQLSNLFGDEPLVVGAATVAVQQRGAAVVPGSVRSLSFGGGAAGVTVPVGGVAESGPLAYPVHAGESLEVSVYVSGPDLVTAHYDAGPLSYSSLSYAGNLTEDTSGVGLVYGTTWARWVSAVDVAGGATPPEATVVLGDSISDGFNIHCPTSLCDLVTPWPDVLAERMRSLPAAERVGVADESITANTLTLVDTAKAADFRAGGGGPPGVERVDMDALEQPGVNRLVLLLGTNDLWFGATASQVIAGMRQILADAAAAHVGVIGVTLLPREGSQGWTASDEVQLQAVNHWILTSKAFPVVLDLAAVVGDVYDGACNPNALYPPYNSGDFLHPDQAGQIAMADAVPTRLLGAGAAPPVRPLVAVTPTKACAHPPVVLVNHAFPADSPPPTTGAPTTTTTAPTTTTTTAPSTTTTLAPTTTTPPATETSSTGLVASLLGRDAWVLVLALVVIALAVAIAIGRAAGRRGRHRQGAGSSRSRGGPGPPT